MKHVFVNRYFHPDISATSQMLSDLAFHLAAEDEVHVVTSRQRYEDARVPLPSRETIHAVHVHRVWTTRFGRSTLAGRALDYLTFYLSAAWRLAALASKGDTVVALTDPPVISIPAMVVAKWRRARLINWLHDIFPETAAALGMRTLRGVLGRPLRWLRDCSLRTASANVALGDGMASIVRSRGVPAHRVHVVHNWADGDAIRPVIATDNPLRSAWKLQDRFVVGYSGNMGRAHDLDVVMRAANRLRERDDLAFLFVGEGHRKAALERSAQASGLRNVIFRPYQPRELLPQSLTAADCHIVSLLPQLEGLIVPSKLYGVLAAGRPVIFIGSSQGEIARLLRQYDFGACVEDGDDDELAKVIARWSSHREEAIRLGENGRKLLERRFDRRVGLAAWSAILRA